MIGLDILRNLKRKLDEIVFQFNKIIGLESFDVLWDKTSRFPKRICLSLSLLCNSNCIFCAERGKAISTKLMPFELLMKVLDELEENNFKGEFSLSEGGEALTHPEFKKIIGEIRKRFPKNKLWLYSNMVLMDKEMSQFLLEHNLNFLHFNFDGASARNYDYIKRNKRFEQVKNNIQDFFTLRNALHSDCAVQIGIIDAKRYSEEIEGRFGIFDADQKEIRRRWAPYLRWGDCISREPIFLLKYQFLLNRKKTEDCHLFKRILSDMFIAPDGRVYICCFDFGMVSSLGNINDQSMRVIWSSKIRRDALKNIFLRNFEKAFSVCQTCLPYPDSILLSQRMGHRKVKRQLLEVSRRDGVCL